MFCECVPFICQNWGEKNLNKGDFISHWFWPWTSLGTTKTAEIESHRISVVSENGPGLLLGLFRKMVTVGSEWEEFISSSKRWLLLVPICGVGGLELTDRLSCGQTLLGSIFTGILYCLQETASPGWINNPHRVLWLTGMSQLSSVSQRERAFPSPESPRSSPGLIRQPQARWNCKHQERSF